MSNGFTSGREHLESGKRVVEVSPTPIVLTYFAEVKEGTRQEITRAVFNVASRLKETDIRINAVFRGNSGDTILNY